MDATKTTTNWIIAGLVALVVIIGGGWLIARERSGDMMAGTATSTGSTSSTSGTVSATEGEKASPSAKPSSKPAVPDATASAAGETITVMDQPAGNVAIIADLEITKPSWVVVRDTKQWALGAAWYYASGKSLEVPLLRNTVAGQTYEAVIYVDDGDKKFSLHAGDMLVTGTEGAPVSSTFTAR